MVPVDIDLATKLAFDRTLVAHERTMLAWVRTAVAFITFGFSVYKFFQLERGGGEAPQPHPHLIGARGFALALVGLGVGTLVLAAFEYRSDIRLLRRQYATGPRPMAVLAVILTAALGTSVLVAMVLRQ